MVRRSRISSAAQPWPVDRAGVPAWLELRYGVAAVGNPAAPGELQPDPELPGLAEARAAAAGYVVHRDAPELREQARRAQLPAVKISRWRMALAGEAAAARAGALMPSERRQLLIRFVRAFRSANRDLPLAAVLAIAWWEGYRTTVPSRTSVRALERLLQRHEQRRHLVSGRS